ncbi:MAG: nitroreductase family deazaflavin-dependent oxidoreductase [Pseudonocardiales bacterium]
MADFNSKVIEEFRAMGGRASGLLADTPLILVHHVGAKSGIERVVPLAYSSRADGRFVVIASHGGSTTHPAWYFNLRANPRISVEVGTQTLAFLAEELDAAARAELWPTLVAESPAVGVFQTMAMRTIPVFILIPDDQRPAEDKCDTC